MGVQDIQDPALAQHVLLDVKRQYHIVLVHVLDVGRLHRWQHHLSSLGKAAATQPQYQVKVGAVFELLSGRDALRLLDFAKFS